MQLDGIKALIADSLDKVESLLNNQLDSPVQLIKEISTHLIDAGGKRIRPILVLLTSKAYGNQQHTDITLAAAIELIHAATLLHDDVVDNSQLRRGRKTANAVWDNAASVLVGDFLYSRAFQLIVDIESQEILQMLAGATNTISTGEVLQLQNRHNPHITEQDYLNVLRYKTGALFSAATQTGAILAYRPDEEVKLMANFGESLGLAFQLADDALDFSANPSALGKNLGDDLADGKMTMPLLHALKNADLNDQQTIQDAIINGDTEALPILQNIIQKTNSIAYTLQVAESAIHEAQRCLQVLPPTPYKEALINLTDLIIHRSN